MTLYEMVRRLRKRPPPLCAEDTRPSPDEMAAIQRSIDASESIREAVQRTMEALEQREKQ